MLKKMVPRSFKCCVYLQYTDFIYTVIVLLHFAFLFKCAATKAWTTSTAWKWRTWCLCTTCCWRCWMPTSCTAPVCLATLPSRSPGTGGRLPLGHTAVVTAPQIPGLPAALEAEVNRSSRIRIQVQWNLSPLCTRLMRRFTGTFCSALNTVNSHWWNLSFDTLYTNSSKLFKSSKLILKTLLRRQTKPAVLIALRPHIEKTSGTGRWTNCHNLASSTSNC